MGAPGAGVGVKDAAGVRVGGAGVCVGRRVGVGGRVRVGVTVCVGVGEGCAATITSLSPGRMTAPSLKPLRL